MLSIKSLTIALFSAAAINASFFIPTDLADGAYTFVNGVATPIDASASSTAKRDASAHPHSSPNLSKRLVNPVTHCDGFSYNSPDYVNAYNDMNAWCAGGAQQTGNTGYFFQEGSAVAYICNYGGTNTCYGEFITADNLMNANCGDGNAAYVSVTAYDKTYGRTNAGVEICF